MRSALEMSDTLTPTSRSTDTINIVIRDVVLGDEHVDRIRKLSPQFTVKHDTSPQALRTAHIIYANDAQFDVSEAPKLRWVQLNTAAVGHLANTALAASGTPIANVRGAYTVDVAEMTIGLLLSLTRRLHVFGDLQQRKDWPAGEAPPQGESCDGKVLGIIGYGSIGREIARLAKAMGMTILACKRNPEQRRDSGYSRPHKGDPDGEIPVAWFSTEQMAEMLGQCDIAICTLPLTPSTIGIVGQREFAALPRGAYFINIGRGKVVDEDALVRSLRNGQLAGAALDVVSVEPLGPESPLWSVPNLIITPHVGSWTIRQTAMAVDVFIENLKRDLVGQELINLVDPRVGY